VKKANQKEVIKLLGLHLQKLRRSKGLSQKDISYATDLEISQISRIERGIINTSVGQLVLIAECLQVSLKELFDFEIEE
jgi:transcriptional regulator with XRE-family HTH domain